MRRREAPRSLVTKLLLRQFFQNKHDVDSTLVTLFKSQMTLLLVEVTKRENRLQLKISLLFVIRSIHSSFYLRPDFSRYIGTVPARTPDDCPFDHAAFNRHFGWGAWRTQTQIIFKME